MYSTCQVIQAIALISFVLFLSVQRLGSNENLALIFPPNPQGVTYLLRDLPISAKEYAFGRSKIFIRSLGVVDQLEEWRRDRLEELVVLIQKIWRGWHARQNWVKLRDSQIVISTYWKRWKDKSHITELKMRRKQEWAVVIVQKHYRRWQVQLFVHLVHIVQLFVHIVQLFVHVFLDRSSHSSFPVPGFPMASLSCAQPPVRISGLQRLAANPARPQGDEFSPQKTLPQVEGTYFLQSPEFF